MNRFRREWKNRMKKKAKSLLESGTIRSSQPAAKQHGGKAKGRVKPERSREAMKPQRRFYELI